MRYSQLTGWGLSQPEQTQDQRNPTKRKALVKDKLSAVRLSIENNLKLQFSRGKSEYSLLILVLCSGLTIQSRLQSSQTNMHLNPQYDQHH